ncbi:AMP-binding protein [Vibrio splendidus]
MSNGDSSHLNYLFDFVNDCIESVPYYRNKAMEVGIDRVRTLDDFRKLPLLSKEDISLNSEAFQHPRTSKSYLVSTGGSTGKQFTFKMSNQAYGKEWAYFSFFLEKRGINIDSKRLCLRGVSGINPNSLVGYNNLYKEMLVSPFRLNDFELKRNFSKIKRYNATWIHGYPSSVALLAKHLCNCNLTLESVKDIVLVSEKLYPEQVKMIRKAFNCNIYTFYGMSERVVFASEENDTFFPEPNYGFTEEVDGELIGTGFLNDSTVMIRYRTGDEVEVIRDSNDVVVEIPNIAGRWGKDMLVGFNGEQISMTALNIHSSALDNVMKYQFVQYEKGKVELKLVPSSSFNLDEIDNIVNVFQSKAGEVIKIDATLVDNIPLSKRGKHLFVLSYL